MTDEKKMNTGGWGYMKVVTILFPYSCSKTENIVSLYQQKKPPNMKHGREMLLIAGYSIAIVGHLVLITWLSLLLNHSLNLI